VTTCIDARPLDDACQHAAAHGTSKRTPANRKCTIVPTPGDGTGDEDRIAQALVVARTAWIGARDARSLRKALFEILSALDDG
jgi:hypothetical protein